MSISFSTRCQNSTCGRPILVDGNSVGRSVMCPECWRPFRVESFQAVKPGTDPALPFAEICDSSEGLDESEELPLKSLGRFELKKVLGKGGFGHVYLAWDPHLERLVALKVAFSGPGNGKHRERVLREAKAQLLLQHNAIVPAFECDQIDGRLYIVFEYIEGETLSSRIRKGPVERRQAVQWVRDLANALAFAHARRVIHRDVKPHNILINPAGRPFITDFGLVHWLDDGGDLTKPGSFTGTIPYMAPELLSGNDSGGDEKAAFLRTVDQYSLGVVLYELLTRHRPFEGRFTAVVAKKIAQEAPCPSQFDPDIPGDLAAICLKAIRRDPEHRHSDCSTFAIALTEWLADSEKIVRSMHEPVLEPRRSIVPGTRAIHWPQLWKAMGLFMAASALLLTIVGIIDAWPPTNEPSRPRSSYKPPYLPPPQPLESLDLNPGKMSASDVLQAQKACARKLEVEDVKFTNSIGMKLCLVPPGQFAMGTSETEREEVLKQSRSYEELREIETREPEHNVEISAPFFMSQLEVTEHQYQRVVGSRRSGNSNSNAVGNITYKEAMEFCRKLSELQEEKDAGHLYCLPTEAQWEFACRANFSTPKDFPDGALGIKNLLGGQSEWCLDWFGAIPNGLKGEIVKDPLGLISGEQRVVRGGSGLSPDWFRRPGYRGAADPEKRDENRGFRVILKIDVNQ